MKALKISIFLALILSCLGVSVAQTTTASLSGTVYDEKEAVVAGASVKARNQQTGFERTFVTGNDGRYSFINLPIGEYSLSVEAPSFSKFVQNGIILVVNQCYLESRRSAGSCYCYRKRFCFEHNNR
jgi:hypothetical protein